MPRFPRVSHHFRPFERRGNVVLLGDVQVSVLEIEAFGTLH